MAVLRVKHVAILRTVQVSSFTCKKSAAILHMVQVVVLLVTQCGAFTYNTGWQFQVQSVQLKSGLLTKP